MGPTRPPPPRPLGSGEQWNVFLFYRSVSRPWVLNLYDELREMDHQVFLDQCELKAGDHLVTRLEDALRSSQAGVLVWSSATSDSDWVQREYQSRGCAVRLVGGVDAHVGFRQAWRLLLAPRV